MEEVSKRKDLNAFADEAFLKRMSELPIKFGIGISLSVSGGFILSVADYGKYQALHILDFIDKLRNEVATSTLRYSQLIHIGDDMIPVEPTSLLVVLNPQGYSIKVEYPYKQEDR